MGCAVVAGMLAVLALVIVVVVPGMWRSAMYPHPSSLPAVVPETMADLLQKLEVTLQVNAPDVYASLQPGLSKADIAQLEAQSGITLTDQLRELYMWRNGVSVDCSFIPIHRFMPLDEAVQEYLAQRQQVQTLTGVQKGAYTAFAGYRDSWLALFPDSFGDGYFYDPQRRHVGGEFFYHFAEVGHYRWFPSLRNFIAGVTECYDTGAYRIANDPRQPEEDFAQTPQIWMKYSSEHSP